MAVSKSKTYNFPSMTRQQAEGVNELMRQYRTGTATQGNWNRLLNAFGQYTPGAAFQRGLGPGQVAPEGGIPGLGTSVFR